MLVIPEFRRLRQEDPELEVTLGHQALFSNKFDDPSTQGNHGFKASLSYIGKPCHKHKSNSKNDRVEGPQRSGS